MILNSLGGWMDSDLAYEDEFAPARICLMEFVEKYIKGVYYVCDTNYPGDFILKVFELGYRVVSDSLGLANSEETHLPLAYSALRLLNLLDEYKDNIDSWNESIDDVYNDVIELFIKQAEVPAVYQPIILVNQILSRVVTRVIPPDKIKDQYENLYKFVGSRSFDIQRTVVSLLRSFIPEIQDALVVETTLSKPSVDSDDEDGCKLPSILIDNIKTIEFEDYLENEDHAQVYSYLWSWLLILDHFSNITQKIRQDYITHLGEDCIHDFLTFIFKELNGKRLSIFDEDQSLVTTYTIPEDETDFQDDLNKLLVNLIYLSMKHFGGNLTQIWINSIRDMQLRNKFESFIIK
ncbi:unnamed protein product [Ambrosiozyma monospora]|uniref:E3 ubiquitin-protein ligase listerin n=1 Tax=Ambrosiozyma monospora TaxID=43982 RepID=A0A9W6T5P3_AMBMO|nr:unnamed protein product [Ambrosiozyma monospora]